ncbi:hypothetical protein [Amycolatopsis acididurans]|uniref:hypothetical protein n=1 Tax=Amycolatopsis acididurans TaxID=2724524 RepID=UPI001B339A04|nr:hypothetical protein [Amycolatopsis acididurans]
MSSTKDLKECVLCGRRGVQGFTAADALTWRCANQIACQRRLNEAEQDRPHTPDASQPETGTANAAVAGMAREIEGLRKAVAALPPLSMRVEDLARVVQDLAAKLAESPAEGNPALSWLALPADPEMTREVLDGLCRWLAEVFLRYPDGAGALPECWLWHPDVVEELLWLMRTWLAAYEDADASALRAGDWHDRYRPGVVKRIKTATGSCSLENHLAGGSHHRPAPAVPLTEAAERMAAWWSTARGDAAPEPTPEHLQAARDVDAQQRRTGMGGRR